MAKIAKTDRIRLSISGRMPMLTPMLEDGDHHVIVAVLGDTARSKGMTRVERDSGLGRENLYKSLSQDGNPEFSTVLQVLNALGIRLRATIVDEIQSDN